MTPPPTPFKTLALMVGLATLLLTGCSSTGTLGMISNSESEADLGPHDDHTFHRVGSAIEGTSCRHFILGVLPLGRSDIESAMRKALSKHPELKADGMVNVATQSTLYGFFPLYNVYTVTCTTIRGIPIRFEHAKIPPKVSVKGKDADPSSRKGSPSTKIGKKGGDHS